EPLRLRIGVMRMRRLIFAKRTTGGRTTQYSNGTHEHETAYATFCGFLREAYRRIRIDALELVPVRETLSSHMNMSGEMDQCVYIDQRACQRFAGLPAGIDHCSSTCASCSDHPVTPFAQPFTQARSQHS